MKSTNCVNLGIFSLKHIDKAPRLVDFCAVTAAHNNLKIVANIAQPSVHRQAITES